MARFTLNADAGTIVDQSTGTEYRIAWLESQAADYESIPDCWPEGLSWRRFDELADCYARLVIGRFSGRSRI